MKSKKNLNDAVGTIKLDPDTHSSSSSSAKREEQSMAKAHMALVSFCDQLLRQKDDGKQILILLIHEYEYDSFNFMRIILEQCSETKKGPELL